MAQRPYPPRNSRPGLPQETEGGAARGRVGAGGGGAAHVGLDGREMPPPPARFHADCSLMEGHVRPAEEAGLAQQRRGRPGAASFPWSLTPERRTAGRAA